MDTLKRYSTSIVQITLALGWQTDSEDSKPPILLDSIVRATITDYVEARRDDDRATSTILNDLTAWSHVLSYASNKGWISENPIRSIERRQLVGQRRSLIIPPTDAEVLALIEQISGWSQDMAALIRWLRNTGMRLSEALSLRVADVHPCGTKATLRLGVKRNRGADGGPMTRTIDLGRAAALLPGLSQKGRIFAPLHQDAAVVSTRYGQWQRQRLARDAKSAADTEPLRRFRLHDLRHAFAVASLVDDDTCIYKLSTHPGHILVSTTEIYSGHLRRDGAMWRYSRNREAFGALPPASHAKINAA